MTDKKQTLDEWIEENCGVSDYTREAAARAFEEASERLLRASATQTPDAAQHFMWDAAWCLARAAELRKGEG